MLGAAELSQIVMGHDMNYTELTEKLVKKCLSLGADAAEVYLETSRNLSIQVLNSEIETIEEASSQGVGFRVFAEGRMGFSHCNDFSDKSLEETISKASAFAKLSTPDENNILPSDNSFTEVADLYDAGIQAAGSARTGEKSDGPRTGGFGSPTPLRQSIDRDGKL